MGIVHDSIWTSGGGDWLGGGVALGRDKVKVKASKIRWCCRGDSQSQDVDYRLVATNLDATSLIHGPMEGLDAVRVGIG